MNNPAKFTSALALVMFVSMNCPLLAWSERASVRENYKKYKTNGRISVKFQSGTDEAYKIKVLSKIGKFRNFVHRKDTYIVEVRNGLSVQQAIANLKDEKTLLWAEPDFLVPQDFGRGKVGNSFPKTPTNYNN